MIPSIDKKKIFFSFLHHGTFFPWTFFLGKIWAFFYCFFSQKIAKDFIGRPRRRLGSWRRSFQPPSLGSMIPNMITLGALCMGISSMRFALMGQWKEAVSSILLAGILDGLDGRLARLLNSSSDFGAELDSLVDFVNFGIAPIILLYAYGVRFLGNYGWIFCLFFSCCMALRLARFNVQRTAPNFSQMFSVGVPAPFGALMVLWPVVLGFVTETHVNPKILLFFLCVTSFFLISRYPTFVFKKISLSRRYGPIVLLGSLIFIICSVTLSWETLLFTITLYMASLPLSGYVFYKKKIS